jgi:hypothetical protein
MIAFASFSVQSDPDDGSAEHDCKHGRDQQQRNALPVNPGIDRLVHFARIAGWHFVVLAVFAHARQPNAMYMLAPRQTTTMAIGIAIILSVPAVPSETS